MKISKWWLAVIFVAVAAVALGIAIIVSGSHSSAGANPGLRIQPTGTVADEKAVPPTPVQAQPYETAQDVAKTIGCINYVDLGPAPMGGVYSHGHCTLHGTKMTIDTFRTQADRDAWLKIATAKPFYIVPQWESATSVTYPAVDK